MFKCELDDPAAQEEHLEFLRRCIQIGQELGTNIIRLAPPLVINEEEIDEGVAILGKVVG